MQLFANRICDLNTRTSLSGVVWDNCFTVTTPPTTTAGGFNEVLTQLCAVKASIPPAGVDTYKVKVDAADVNEDYLINKITTDGCIGITHVTGSGSDVLHLTADWNVTDYTYDPAYFDVTPVTVPGQCWTDTMVSLKAGLIQSGATVDCQTMVDLFGTPGDTTPTSLYGNNAGECHAYTPCAIRNMVFESALPGSPTGTTYGVAYDPSSGSACGKFLLTPLNLPTPNVCWTGTWTNMSISTGSHAFSGGTYDVTSLAGPVFSDLPSENTPGYRISKEGLMTTRGTVGITITDTTGDTHVSRTLKVPMTTILSSCVGSGKALSVQANTALKFSAAGVITSRVEPYMVYDPATGELYLYINYYMNTTSSSSLQMVVTLDGLLMDFN